MYSWAKSVSEKIKQKYPLVVNRNEGKVPYTAIDGRFDDLTGKDIGWWTNGFYGGILWQLYHATEQEKYGIEAQKLEDKLDAVLMNYGSMDHDSGFRFLTTAVADYRVTRSEHSKNRGLLAAANLAGRFNAQGNYIRAWNDNGDGSNAGRAIIDCMMNLPLLYWATEVTNDARFYQIAIRHADTAMKYFIRDDGSAIHIVDFNPENGEFVRDIGGQGYQQGSAWTRGQAWALYGFTLSYLHTGKIEYLNTARKVAAYFIANIPKCGLIPVDFRQPKDCTWEDSTAAAIASSGLLLLAEILSGREELTEGYRNPLQESIEDEAERAQESAYKMLRALDEKRCCWTSDRDELLEKCTAAYHDDRHEFPIIYGDYYFIEAIFRLTGEELFIW